MASICVAAPIILGVHFAEHVYNSDAYSTLPVFRGVTVAQTAEALSLAKILIDGAAKAALVTLAVSVVVQIDVFKVYDKIITITQEIGKGLRGDTLQQIAEDLNTLKADQSREQVRVQLSKDTLAWIDKVTSDATAQNIEYLLAEQKRLVALAERIPDLEQKAANASKLSEENAKLSAQTERMRTHLEAVELLFGRFTDLSDAVRELRRNLNNP